MAHGEKVVRFEPRPPDPAQAMRKRLETPPDQPAASAGETEHFIEGEILRRMGELESEYMQLHAQHKEEAIILASMWGLDINDIERSPRAENFLEAVRDAERTVREMGSRLHKIEKLLAEMRSRAEAIREQRRGGAREAL